MSAELLPCPFCGHIGLDFSEEGSTYRWASASCAGCGATTGETRKHDGWRCDAIEQWNRRAAPTHPAQPAAWMYQHDETGQVGFVDEQQIEWGFWTNNPRLHAVSPLYAHPPVEPVKEADVSDEVLTDDQIEDIWAAVSPFDGEVDMIEYARKIESAVVLALRGGTS